MGSKAFGAAALAVSLLLAGEAAPKSAESQGVGLFSAQGDVGEVGLSGSGVYDAAARSYRVTGGGANIWADRDSFHYLWARRSGDIHIAADASWATEGGDPHRKAGVMIRQDLTPGSPYADVMYHGNGLVALQYREVRGGPTHEIIQDLKGPGRMRLEKEGAYVYFSVGAPGSELHHAGGNIRIRFPGSYYVGLAVSAHDNKARETARFADVSITVPKLAAVPDTGYPAAVESSLEVMQVSDTEPRRVVRHFSGKIEAPNWTRDGQSLVYNSGGLIYRIPLEGGGDPVAVDTGPQRHSNNDHGLSPDGTQLAISDQSEPDGHSRVYVLPLAGSSSPRLVVGDSGGPSYWHGWSPDGRTIAFVGDRTQTNDYDIYAVDAAGGAERRLTTAKGLDDGPEYSPDGRFIYFNSVRSGAMQIWRMGPDGSNPEQITKDPAYRDWFPHISPDGRWMAFVSFGQDVTIGDHPPNRDVEIRIMPTDGSAPPRVLTRIFGGQGTLNVPSWSPDSKSIAFVSYRLVR